MNSSKEKVVVNHPQVFDSIDPDFSIREKIRAYRAIVNCLREHTNNVSKISANHLRSTVFMLGYTLAEIGTRNPYEGAEVGRKLGDKVVINPVDSNFQFKEDPPEDSIEKIDFLRANITKLIDDLKKLYPSLAIYEGYQFVTFDRVLQELYLAKGYLGAKLYIIASKDDSYKKIDSASYSKNTISMPDSKKKFDFK